MPNVSRNNWDIFAEFNVPIVKGLEVNAAVRFDDYQNVGNTTNPKVSVRWTPTPAVLLRGSWGTGFRAPTLVELFSANFVSASGGNYSDPQRCPITNSADDCNVQFNNLLGGNAALKPEKSTQWGLGAVWEPVSGNSIGVDYWNIKIDNVVGTLGEQSIYGSTGELIPASVASGLITRLPQTPQDIALGIPGHIQYAIQTNLNIQKLQVDGLDFTLKARSPAYDWGQITASYLGTYYINWKQTDLSTGQQVNYVGQSVGGIAVVNAGPGFPASLPRYKGNLAVNWTLGPWGATLTNVYQDGYTDDNGCNVAPQFSGTCPRNVGSYSVWDLTGSYTGFKNWTLMGGVKNLFNTNPPASNQAEAFQFGYDPTYADPRGAFWWGSIKFAWGSRPSRHRSRKRPHPRRSCSLLGRRHPRLRRRPRQPAPQVQKITLDSKVLFDFDKAVLKPEGKAAIDAQIVGKIAQVQKLEVVLVTGHTDRLGTEAHNQQLSLRRADTVRDYLVSKGVDKSKIETVGMGPKQPVVQCDQKQMKALIECLQPNRRVDVQVKGETTK